MARPRDARFARSEDRRSDEFVHLQSPDVASHDVYHALEKLGWECTVVFCLSPLISVAAMGFLVYLWNPTTAPSWPAMFTTTWLTRSITITTVAIRLVVDLITGYSASMLAALALEAGSVRLGGLATLSVMRSSAPSLWDLLLALRHAGESVGKCCLYYTLLLAGLSISLQFSSTILLSDFGIRRLPGMPRQESYYYDLDWGWRLSGPNSSSGQWNLYDGQLIFDEPDLRSPWSLRPEIFPIFGEYRKPIPPQDTIDDTGYVLRAFLPFTTEKARTSISRFHGPSFVLDSRVSCQKPILADLSLTVLGDSDDLTINGTVSNHTSVADLWFPKETNHDEQDAVFTWFHGKGDRVVPFSCQLISDLWGRSHKPAYHICQLQNATKHTVQIYNHTQVQVRTEAAGSLRSNLFIDTIGEEVPSFGPAYLIIVLDGYEVRFTPDEADQNVFAYGYAPTWPYNGLMQGLGFAASICYTSWGSSNAIVEMSTSEELNEPEVLYEREHDPGKGWMKPNYSLDTVLDHFGATSRGGQLLRPVMAMETPFIDPEVGYPLQQPSIARLPMLSGPGPFTLRPGKTDEYLSDFWQAMEKSHNSPASSLSALLTLLSTTTYYNMIAHASSPGYLEGNASTVYFESVSCPLQWNGLITLGALLAIHHFICFTILYLFIGQTGLTQIGNVWPSIAQIYGPGTKDIIRKSTLASDAKIQRALDESGMGDALVQVSLNASEEKICGPIAAGGTRRRH
ncbi:hypothetical protein F4780DRAFT_772074 [Xylariomycetidae sp. FL0641]|nr:hypothetical protein F4780DRAFT_772074 [Xylariomycetidae sp. FL0641]